MEREQCEDINKHFEAVTNTKQDFDVAFQKAVEEGKVKEAKVLKEKLESQMKELWEKLDPYDLRLRRELAKKLDASWVSKESEGAVVIEKEGSKFLIDVETGEQIGGPYTYAEIFKDGIAVCESQGKLVYVNREGENINNTKAKGCGEGIVTVQGDSGRYYFLRADGSMLNDKSFTSAGYFIEGLAPVCDDGGNWNYLNKHGEFEFRGKSFKDASGFNEERALVKVGGQNRCGYIDKKGELVTEEEYLDGRMFSGGRAAVKTASGRWEFIDKSGNSLSNREEYIDALNFIEGRAAVRPLSGGWKFIDENGNNLNEEVYAKAYSFHEGIAAVLKLEDDLWYLIDREGKEICSEGFAWVSNFHDGFAVVQKTKGEKYYYIDKQGKKAFDQEFDRAQAFQDGLASVAKMTKQGIELFWIDTRGRRFI